MIIRINSQEDVKAGKPLYNSLKPKKIINDESTSVGILEGSDGKTEIMFFLEKGDELHVAQLTYGELEGVYHAARHAKAVFEANQKLKLG